MVRCHPKRALNGVPFEEKWPGMTQRELKVTPC
jgi:hypothetical protein